MANSMLTMPYMTSLLNQAKTHYTITDKSSGEVLGYAFMIVDGEVMLDQVQMVPWQAQEDYTDRDHDHHQRAARAVDNDDGTDVEGRLVSDVDISQDSSINETEEEAFSSPGNFQSDIKTVSYVDQNANFKTSFVSAQEKNVVSSWRHSSSSSSTSSPPSLLSPVFPTALASVTQSLAAQIAAKIVLEATEDNVDSILEVKEDIKVEKTNADKAASSEVLGSEVVGEIKCEADLVTTKKVDNEKTAAAGKSIGKYRAFYSELPESQSVDKFKPRNLRKVRCLLCTDGRILSIGNFGEHCKSFHEPPVQCNICGGEFRPKKLSNHMKVIEETAQDKFTSQHRDLEMSSSEDHISPPESDHSLQHGTLTDKDSKIFSARSKDDINSSVTLQKVSFREDKVSFTLSSATVKGIAYKVKLRKGSKIKKAMKKFGKKFKVVPKELRFTLGGKELTGKEVAERLEGRQIVVWGELK